MEVARLTIPLFALVLAGYLFARVVHVSQQHLRYLTLYVVYVALPALLFQMIRTTSVSVLENFGFIGATTGATLITFISAYSFGRWGTRRPPREATMMGMAGSYANIGYMGPALTLASFGEVAAAPTALILCFDNVLMFTLVPLLVALSDREVPVRQVLPSALRSVVTHPFILATWVGFLCAYTEAQVPPKLDVLLNMLRATAAPCALFAMGMVVASHRVRQIGPGVIPTTLCKLILHPALVFTLLQTVGGVDPVWISTAVLMAALPCALNVFVFAQQYEAYVPEASALVLGTTCLSALTVSGLLWRIL